MVFESRAAPPDEMKMIHLILLTGLSGLMPGPYSDLHDAGAEAPSSPRSNNERRIVKRFDFAEQADGNFERMPRNWRHLRGPGFPRFLEARFDEAVGRTEAPSFFLPASGASIAAEYLARDIDIQPGSEYRIEGWILPGKLENAAARISAQLLDHAFRPIADSERFSAPVRGVEAEPAWARVEIKMPGNFERARWMAITCRVEQPGLGPASAAPLLSLQRHDRDASAWFDDIRVLRMPDVSLSCGAQSVFGPGEAVELRARVADADQTNLEAGLDLLDADGKCLSSSPVRPVPPTMDASPIVFRPPSAGAYVARLWVRADGELVADRCQPFIQLGVRRPSVGASSRLGILASRSLAHHFEATSRMIELLAPSYVALPVWRRDTTEAEIVHGDAGVDRLLRFLESRRVSVIAKLESPPEVLLQRMGKADASILGLLSGPAAPWRAYLALLLTRYGGQVKAWQVGDADALAGGDTQGLITALEFLRGELRPLLVDSELVAPAIMGRTPVRTMPAEIVSLDAGDALSAERLTDELRQWGHTHFKKRWVNLQPLSPDRYRREARLVDMAQRMVLALAGGADAIFVPQPWTMEGDGDAAEVIPDEALAVEVTIAWALAGMRPGGSVWLDHGVEARLFESADRRRGALVAWSCREDRIPLRRSADFPPMAELIDPRGSVRSLNAIAEAGALVLDSMPRIIAPVDPQRWGLRAAFRVEPTALRPMPDWQDATVVLGNSLDEPLSGLLKLEGAPGWKIEPDRLTVSLEPGRKARWPIRIRVPTNEAFGEKALVGRLMTDRTVCAEMTLRAPLIVSTGPLDVNVLTRREEDGIVVVQRITNRGPGSLNLRASLVCPNQPTQTRLIPKLASGQTAVREYALPISTAASGPFARATVEELDGPARHNAIVTAE